MIQVCETYQVSNAIKAIHDNKFAALLFLTSILA